MFCYWDKFCGLVTKLKVDGCGSAGLFPQRSSDGGGLYISESTDFDRMRIVGCVIRDNHAGDQGGGVYVSNGRPTFVSCTIAGNEAASGGAIYNTSSSNAVTLVNTLRWNPDAPEETAGQTSSIVRDHSLSRDAASGNVLIDGADQLTADPGLGYDYSLVAASPARDTGTNVLHPALDLDGEPLIDGLKDIGADEFNDADADGLPDWVEALGASDAASDADGDTLNNLDEYETHWTNPNDPDTDGDQLDDAAELTAGTDALDPDTDGDALPDGWEVNYGLDPLDGATADGDPDGDTLLTSEEFELGTNPSSDDTDGDGLKDNVESTIFASTDPSNFYYLDPTNPDTDGDGISDGLDSADGDELSNLDELALGTDPNLADTDADGVNDSGEVDLGTDPLTNDDFANRDSDNDGLTDLFEINFGTDPNDADTNGNGMNDGEELDNGGDPINPGPPPAPLDPDDPPDPDPFPPAPPSIYPGSYDILIESKSISFPKHGHRTFQNTDPAKRYLLKTASQSYGGSDGEVESGPFGISGTGTWTIDPITGEETRGGDKHKDRFFVTSFGDPRSPLRLAGTREQYGYDDPPNEKADGTATIHETTVLSNENTTAMMVANGKNELEDYEDTFSTWSGTPRAYRNVHENELRFDYRKVRFKFKWDADTAQEEKFPIRYYVLFIPEDDPGTAENEEETELEIVDTIEWDGVGDESPVFEIDPDSLKYGEDGRYRLLQAGMVPDWDRDGTIDQFDRNKATSSDPFRFWINDDDDPATGEVHNDDVPKRGNDADANSGLSGRVDGMRDLVDFFPLWFDVRDLLSEFDDLQAVDLRLSGPGLRFLQFETGYTGFTASQAGQFLKDVDTARDLADDDTTAVSGDSGNPRSLGSEFVTLASQGKGVLLMESCEAVTGASLTLHVFLDDEEVLALDDFHFRTGDVEDMYLHHDLTAHAKNYDGTVATGKGDSFDGTESWSTGNWPDERTNGKTFVFVHGYGVSENRSRGWQAEVFKRMHQLGSNARFVGVTWNGDTGLDYHKAVFQALQTGAAFGEVDVSGEATAAGHSAGNLVLGQAIQSGVFIPARYYMINAAVPIQAYDGGAGTTDMVERDWTSVDPGFYASNWHRRFDGTGDARNGLTWRAAFSSVAQLETHNFYSPGEEVLAKLPEQDRATAVNLILNGGLDGRGVWKAQELVKGKDWTESLLSIPMTRSQGGWRLNGDYAAGDDIRETPRFEPFLEPDLHSPDPAAADLKAGQTDPNVRFDLLARGIPALSYAAAVDSITGISNHDMEAEGRVHEGGNAVWPTEGHGGQGLEGWLHSDFRNVALPYNFKH